MRFLVAILFLVLIGDSTKRDTIKDESCLMQAQRIVENIEKEKLIIKELEKKNHKLDSIIAVLDSIHQKK
jgi:hypothetical protein